VSIRENLRKGRSHLIIAAILIIAGTIVVRIEDRTLQTEAGKPIPDHGAQVRHLPGPE